MKKIVLIVFIGIMGWVSCTNTKSGSQEFNPKVGIKITNVTVQEMVSGVEGGKSTFKFMMNIETGSELVVVDSIFYHSMKTKVFAKDASKSLYIANAQKGKENNTQLKTSAKPHEVITFTYKDQRIVIQIDSVKVLEQMYLP